MLQLIYKHILFSKPYSISERIAPIHIFIKGVWSCESKFYHYYSMYYNIGNCCHAAWFLLQTGDNESFASIKNNFKKDEVSSEITLSIDKKECNK